MGGLPRRLSGVLGHPDLLIDKIFVGVARNIVGRDLGICQVTAELGTIDYVIVVVIVDHVQVYVVCIEIYVIPERYLFVLENL
jgi:hypothetical protein